jgi:hypothetical protein
VVAGCRSARPTEGALGHLPTPRPDALGPLAAHSRRIARGPRSRLSPHDGRRMVHGWSTSPRFQQNRAVPASRRFLPDSRRFVALVCARQRALRPLFWIMSPLLRPIPEPNQARTPPRCELTTGPPCVPRRTSSQARACGGGSPSPPCGLISRRGLRRVVPCLPHVRDRAEAGHRCAGRRGVRTRHPLERLHGRRDALIGSWMQPGCDPNGRQRCRNPHLLAVDLRLGFGQIPGSCRRFQKLAYCRMKRTTGFEPATFGLGSRRSTN